MPLKRRVGLGGEVADRQIQLQPADIAHFKAQALDGVGDAMHVGIGFTRQADHEIELHLAPAVAHRRLDASAELLIRQSFVDDVAHALGARFRRKRESALARAAKDVGDVVVEAIDALTRQREADVVVLQAVAQLHSHGGQGEVIAATQRQQRKIAVTGAHHAGLNGFHHLLGIHVAGRAGQHPRLTEAAAAGAAPANLHREPVMHRLHMGHQAHGVVRHGRRHPAHNAAMAQRRHVDAGHLRQVAQQR